MSDKKTWVEVNGEAIADAIILNWKDIGHGACMGAANDVAKYCKLAIQAHFDKARAPTIQLSMQKAEHMTHEVIGETR